MFEFNPGLNPEEVRNHRLLALRLTMYMMVFLVGGVIFNLMILNVLIKPRSGAEGFLTLIAAAGITFVIFAALATVREVRLLSPTAHRRLTLWVPLFWWGASVLGALFSNEAARALGLAF